LSPIGGSCRKEAVGVNRKRVCGWGRKKRKIIKPLDCGIDGGWGGGGCKERLFLKGRWGKKIHKQNVDIEGGEKKQEGIMVVEGHTGVWVPNTPVTTNLNQEQRAGKG